MKVRGLVVLVLACVLAAPPARATSLVVPDQAPTIQTAIDAAVDTVIVRPGAYAETLQVGRGVTVLGVSAGSSDRPTIGGLNIYDDYWGEPQRFQRLQFDGPVTAFSYPSGIDISFVECDLRGGITDTRSLGSIDIILLSKCYLVGPLTLPGARRISLDSCQVVGSILCPAEDHLLQVRGCTFQGGGIHSLHYQSTCLAEGNTIRGGGYGIRAEGEIVIANNLIEDCESEGVFAMDGPVTVANNVIRRCGRGIYVNAEWISIVGNVVTQARSEGLVVSWGPYVDVIGNVFWMCVADGMKIMYNGVRSYVKVRQNTSCYNGLSGFASDSWQEGQEWVGNIGYANSEYGINWMRVDAAAIACNDWFANRKGAVKGRPASSEDISADPQFCDALAGDVHLNWTSPLKDWPGCGQIGALATGCGSFVGVIEVAAAPAGFALARVGPVPTTGPIALELTLPRAAAIEVAVLDVQGRTVARLAGGDWTAGRHAVQWNGEGTHGRVPPGLYLIRYRFPGGQACRRIVIAR